MHAQKRSYVSNSQPNESSGLNIHLATNSFSWPLINESRNQNPGTRTNLFVITLVRPNMWPSSWKTDRPQFRLCKNMDDEFFYEYFTSSEIILLRIFLEYMV